LINLLDYILISEDSSYSDLLESFKREFREYIELKKELEKIEAEEKEVVQLKEFATFEIEKIEKVNPKVGEYEELLEQKKLLSKKEKIEEAIERALVIFDLESSVVDALSLIEEDSTFFSEAINELQIKLESAKDGLSELDGLDIESLLNRIEELSSLKSRYGSIEECLICLEEKKKELRRYENIEFEKSELEKRVKSKLEKVENLAKKITTNRVEATKKLNSQIGKFCKKLFLEDITFSLQKSELSSLGSDMVVVNLSNTHLNKVSSGELNRIRLAFLSVYSKYRQGGGVLILDEIDANLSGKESMSVAKVLKELSQTYQIFAISHQPQLSSYASEHFLVYKDGDRSFVKKLNLSQREDELSRMISGENITKEAKEFAKKMLEEAKNI